MDIMTARGLIKIKLKYFNWFPCFLTLFYIYLHCKFKHVIMACMTIIILIRLFSFNG